MYGDIKNVILVLLPLMRVSMPPVILSVVEGSAAHVILGGVEGSAFHVMPSVSRHLLHWPRFVEKGMENRSC